MLKTVFSYWFGTNHCISTGLCQLKRLLSLTHFLTSRHSWRICSDSVVYPDVRGKDGLPENLYKNVMVMYYFADLPLTLTSIE